MKGTLVEECGSKQLLLSRYSKKENRLLPLKPAAAGYSGILTIINKFSDTGRHKVNLVAFVENLQSLVAFVSKYSTFLVLILLNICVFLSSWHFVFRSTLCASFLRFFIIEHYNSLLHSLNKDKS